MQKDSSTRRLDIPITISTEFSYSTPEDGARMAIDSISAYLGSVFYFMKMAVRGHDILDLATEEKPLLEFGELRGNLHAMCEIGEGLSSQLDLYSTKAEKPAAIRRFEERSEPTPGAIHESSHALHKILEDANLPVEFREKLKDLVLDYLFNENTEYFSLDHITACVRDYVSRRSTQKENENDK